MKRSRAITLKDVGEESAEKLNAHVTSVTEGAVTDNDLKL